MATGVWLLYIQQLKDNLVFTGTHNWKGKTRFKNKQTNKQKKQKEELKKKKNQWNLITVILYSNYSTIM